MNIKKQLRTNDEFLQAYVNQTPIKVWFDGELSDTGPIQLLNLRSIKINGTHYMKDLCQFYIAE